MLKTGENTFTIVKEVMRLAFRYPACILWQGLGVLVPALLDLSSVAIFAVYCNSLALSMIRIYITDYWLTNTNIIRAVIGWFGWVLGALIPFGISLYAFEGTILVVITAAHTILLGFYICTLTYSRKKLRKEDKWPTAIISEKERLAFVGAIVMVYVLEFLLISFMQANLV